MCYLGNQLYPDGNREALKAEAISVEELVSLPSAPLKYAFIQEHACSTLFDVSVA